MPAAGGELRLLLGTSLRGLASRKALAFASWVLTTIAVASAVVGPSYQGTSASSFVVTQQHVLDQDAFALALRLYAVVAAWVIGLAVAGLAATLAVQVPARRRDAASVRVVGVPRRSVMVGVVAEFMVVLGSAVVAGIVAGGMAQYVVVKRVRLGISDDAFTPRALPSFHVSSGVRLSALVLVVLLVAASAFALQTVRSARTASLRESAR